MKIFIDTANVEEIKEAASWGILSGVTTNPSLIAKEGREFKTVVREITDIVDGSVSAEVLDVYKRQTVNRATFSFGILRLRKGERHEKDNKNYSRLDGDGNASDSSGRPRQFF